MSNRKLAKEIDQTLKRINEGMDQFDRIHEKLESASTQALREKFEAELKKEIKKLQRCRDSIKQWLGGSEVKDKSELYKYRRLVETKMEQFKEVEKESKMKAYSKEALAKKSKEKRKKKLDEESIKCIEDVDSWIEQIQEQTSEIEEELQELQQGKRIDPEELERLESLLEKHNYYIKNLRETQELLKDDVISTDDINDIRDDIEYYIESCQDPDFVENDSVFDIIMEKKEGTFEEEEEDGEDVPLAEIPKVAQPKALPVTPEMPTPVVVGGVIQASPVDQKPAETKPADTDKKEKQSITPTTSANSTPTPTISQKPATVTTTTTASTTKPPPQPQISYRDMVNQGAPIDKSKKSSAQPSPSGTPSSTPPPTQNAYAAVVAQTMPPQKTIPTNDQGNLSTPPQEAEDALNRETFGSNVLQSNMSPSQGLHDMNVTTFQKPRTIGEIPLSHRLQRSLQTIPSILDTESSLTRSNVKPNVNVNEYFPQTVDPTIFYNPETYNKLSTETLMFAFYFQQGSLQQHFAAKALKRQSWRFHTKYMAWFKRFSPPEETTDTHEVGTYVYFDYDSTAWCQRIKSHFQFNFEYFGS